MTETMLTEAHTDALARISHMIDTAISLDELLHGTLNALMQFFAMESGCIALLDDEGSIDQMVSKHLAQEAGTPLPIDDLPAFQRVIQQRQPVQVYDAEHDGQYDPIWQALRVVQIRSLLLLPMVVHDRAVGVLALGHANPGRRFQPLEMSLTQMFTGHLAAAVVSIRLADAARHRAAELDTLNDIATTVTSSLDTHEVYRLVVQKLSEYFKVDAGSLLLIDEATGDLEFVMTVEGGATKLAGVRVPMGQGVVGHVIQTQQWEIVDDAQHDARFYGKVSEDIGYITRTILCVPMVAKGRTIGAIELLNKLNGHFTENEAARLMRMAAFIGVAIQNARLFQQVADGRDQLAAILNSTSDGIVMTDMHGVVLTANPMTTRLFEMSERQMLGQSIDALLTTLHGRAHEVVTRSWQHDDEAADESESPLHISEIELRVPRHRFIRHLSLPVHDAQGEPCGQLAVFRDITKEKELQQLRDDYTGMMVHDLRAPLTSIMNGIMMIRRGLSGPVNEQQQELLKIVHQGSQTMLQLVNNLLDISKMEEGQMTLDLEPLSPYAIMDQTVERLQVSARTKNVELVQRLAVGLPLVEADNEKIVRVLQNLIDNALKFSPPDSEIILGGRFFSAGQPFPEDTTLHPPLQEGEWLVIWVQDHGLGIPRAYHERIFEKFGQVRGRKLRGTGLGLTFCKLAVEAHKGRIWVESEEGVGSIFAFALPLAHEPASRTH